MVHDRSVVTSTRVRYVDPEDLPSVYLFGKLDLPSNTQPKAACSLTYPRTLANQPKRSGSQELGNSTSLKLGSVDKVPEVFMKCLPP